MKGTLITENKTERSIKAIVHQIGDIDIVEITHGELGSIIGNSFIKSLFSILTGISISAFVSFWIAITTIEIKDPITNAIFIAVIIVFAFATLLCGLFWIKAEIKAYHLSRKYLLKK